MALTPPSLTTAQITVLVQAAVPSIDPANQGNWLVDLSKTSLGTVVSVPAANAGAATTAATAAMVVFATDYAPTLNAPAIQAKVLANLATLETWITNNPSGAVLTAGQTLTLAKMLAGIGRLILGDTASQGGA